MLFQLVGANWVPYTGTYSFNGNSVTNSITLTFDLFFPFFTNIDFQDMYQIRGDAFSRNFIFTNNGGTTPGDFSGYIRFSDSLYCPAIQIDSIQFRIGNYTFPPRLYTPRSWISQDLDTLVVSSGGNIEVKEYLHINGCLDLCNSGICESVRQADTTNISKYQLEWGCDSAHLCKVVGSCSKISRNLNKVASLKLSRVAPAPDSVNFHQGVWENSCPGEITEWVFRLKNEGGANAYDIQWDLNKGYQDAFVLLVNSTTTLDSIFLTGTNGNYFPAQIHEVPSTFHSHCTDTLSILQSLDSCVISIAELKAGDFVDFHFSTIRCCPSDTFLLNTGIAFNKLKMQIIAFHECSVNGTDRVTTLYSPQDSGLFAPFSNITSNKSISLNGAELPDIRLTQSLFPSTSDLTGITHPNPDCNRAAYSYYRIQTTSFLPLDKYTGAIVASTYNADDDSILLTGRLKVHFQLQPGLQLSQPLGVNPVQFSSVIGGINYQWPPVPGSIVDTCNPVKQSFNVYNFEFDLDSIPLLAGNHNRNSLKNFREFINESGIDFYMNACCCTDLGRNFYTISVFFNANPNSCSTCWMPLSETGNEVNVHCPGCTTPGIIVDNYSLIRSYDAGTNSYGLQDTDDNGRADGVQTHSQIDSTYLSNHPQVRKNFSIQGDYLKSTLSAHFVDGVYQLYDSTINQEAGCTLAQWMRSTGDTLDHLYLDQNIPWSNPDKFNLQVHASSLRIIRTNPSLPQLPQTLSGSLTYIDINLFSPVNLITSPDADTSHKDFFYALSINNLRGNNSSLPSNYMFMPGDSFYLSTTYRVCNNFNNYNNESNGDADFCRHESDIVNYMYLTGTSQNYGAALGTPNWAGDTWTACTTCDSTDISTYLPPTCLFKCQTYGGYHFFLDIQSTNQLFIYRSKLGSSDNDKCSNRFYINSSVRIGGNANNVFPFEFRPAFTPDSIYIHVPPNYTITDGSAGSYFSTFHEGCVNHKSTISRLYPVNQQYRIGCVSTDTCSTVPFYDYNSPPYRFRYTIVDEDSLFNSCGDGCIGSPPSELANCRLDTTLALGDESFFQSTYVELSSACSDSLYVEYFDSTIVQVLFPDFSCQGGTHLESVANQTGLDSLVNAHPVLAFNTSTTPTAYSDSVCWDLTLSNISTTDDAHSAFIYLPPPTSDFEFTWTGFSSSGSTGNTIGFNSLGSILKSSFKQYRLCGRLKNCVPGEVQIYYGWNCDTLLDSLGNMCFSAADTLSYSIATSSPQATLSFPPNYYLCSSSTFEIDIQNSNTGTFSIDSIQILSVPHAVINPLCSLKYTKGAYVNSDTISLTGTNMLILSPFNRSNAFFAHDSVSGIGLTEHAILSFSFTPECNFVSDSLPLIAVFTTNYCGESDTIYPVPDSLWVQSGDSCSPGCSGLIVNLKNLPLICAGDSVNLEATVSGGVPPYSYLWTSAGFSSTLSSPSVAPTSTTTYTLQVTDASVTPLSGSGSVVLSVINNNGDCC
ncbi:MAG TPA: hypothetical protein PKL85_07750, partial [Bacteroidia bacterium]|nr:hypothetical protein [Bacteroidia bacterium]